MRCGTWTAARTDRAASTGTGPRRRILLPGRVFAGSWEKVSAESQCDAGSPTLAQSTRKSRRRAILGCRSGRTWSRLVSALVERPVMKGLLNHLSSRTAWFAGYPEGMDRRGFQWRAVAGRRRRRVERRWVEGWGGRGAKYTQIYDVDSASSTSQRLPSSTGAILPQEAAESWSAHVPQSTAQRARRRGCNCRRRRARNWHEASSKGRLAQHAGGGGSGGGCGLDLRRRQASRCLIAGQNSHDGRESRAAPCKISAPAAHRNSWPPSATRTGARRMHSWLRSAGRRRRVRSAVPGAKRCQQRHQRAFVARSTPPHDRTPVCPRPLRQVGACKHQCTSLTLSGGIPTVVQHSNLDSRSSRGLRLQSHLCACV